MWSSVSGQSENDLSPELEFSRSAFARPVDPCSLAYLVVEVGSGHGVADRGRRGVVIAIDGLSGTGKSTLAVELAAELGIACVNTGLYFRLAAHLAREGERTPRDVATELRPLSEPLARYREAESLGGRLRDATLADVLAVVTQDREVREAVLALERADIAALGSAVVEGRDIGTVVVPDAEIKLFLVARDAVRVARRHDEGVAVLERDRANARRAVAPALPAADAIVVDTSDVAVAELVARVRELVVALTEVPA